jgi:hypothetical protein
MVTRLKAKSANPNSLLEYKYSVTIKAPNHRPGITRSKTSFGNAKLILERLA